MLHALPASSRWVGPFEKNHPKTRRQHVAARRRDHPRPERRPFFEKGRRGNPHPQCDPRRRRPLDTQRLGRRTTLLRLHLPKVPPLPHSNPALSPNSPTDSPDEPEYFQTNVNDVVKVIELLP